MSGLPTRSTCDQVSARISSVRAPGSKDAGLSVFFPSATRLYSLFGGSGACGRLVAPPRGTQGSRSDCSCLPKEAMAVKKLLALAVVAGGVLFVVRRNKSSKAKDALWSEATAPAGKKA